MSKKIAQIERWMQILSMELFTLGEIKDVDKKEKVNKFKTNPASGVQKEEWSCIERLVFLTSYG